MEKDIKINYGNKFEDSLSGDILFLLEKNLEKMKN